MRLEASLCSFEFKMLIWLCLDEISLSLPLAELNSFCSVLWFFVERALAFFFSCNEEHSNRA